MKKLIIFLSIISFYASVSAQAPSKRSGDFVTAVDEYSRAGKLSGLAIYPDTLVFNGTNGLDSVGSKIYVRSGANVGEWTREYNGVSQNHWVKVGSGGGGSGCTTFYVTSDSLYFVRDSCGTLDSTQIVADGSSSSGVQSVTGNIVDNTDPANPVVTGISQSQLDDTASAIRSDFSTGSVQSVTGLNTDNADPINPIVKVSVDGATITGLGTPASPLVATASGTALNGTGFVKMAGTTPSYITSPIDSASYHTIVLPSGDSLLVFQKPNGQSDTVSFALLQYWKKYLNNIYYNDGNVAVGTFFPKSIVTISQPIVTASASSPPPDSASLLLENPSISTVSLKYHFAPGLLFKSHYWNSSHDDSSYIKIYPSNSSGTGLNIAKSTNAGVTYTDLAKFNSAPDGGISLLVNTAITGTLSVSGISSLNNVYNSAVNTAGSSTWVDTSAVIDGVSTAMGFHPPAMTTAQRDSMCFAISSITVTNVGLGYTSPPTVNITGSPTLIGATNAALTSTLTSNTVSSVGIVKRGRYTGTPTISFTGGGGSGAAAYATMVQLLDNGLTIYNTTINALQTWNGIKWVTSGTITGTATLASGTVTVSAPSILSTSRIYLTCNTPSGTQGFLSAPVGSIVSGTSFVINSSNAADNSTVNWAIIN